MPEHPASPGEPLGPEDAKLVTLARSARPRALAATLPAQGAAVRDDMGRTYVATTVERGALRLRAVELALAAALTSGSTGFEAAVVVGAAAVSSEDVALLRELGVPVLLLADDRGTVYSRTEPPSAPSGWQP